VYFCCILSVYCLWRINFIIFSSVGLFVRSSVDSPKLLANISSAIVLATAKRRAVMGIQAVVVQFIVRVSVYRRICFFTVVTKRRKLLDIDWLALTDRCRTRVQAARASKTLTCTSAVCPVRWRSWNWSRYFRPAERSSVRESSTTTRQVLAVYFPAFWIWRMSAESWGLNI